MPTIKPLILRKNDAIRSNVSFNNYSVTVTNSSLALPQTPLQAALQDRKACMSQEACPIWKRMAENNCTSALAVGDECHGMRCYSGKINGRCCPATTVHSDHQQFSQLRSRRIQLLFLMSSQRQGMRLPHLQCQVGDPQGDDCKGLLLHKEQPVCDAGSGHGDIETCSDACTDAQSIAMYPSQTLQ